MTGSAAPDPVRPETSPPGAAATADGDTGGDSGSGSMVTLLLLALPAGLVGAATCVAALAVHRAGSGRLALAVAASLGVAWVLRSTGTPRLGAAYCLGWVLVLGGALAGRPEGDYVLASDPAGYVMMATGFALVVLGITSLGRGEVRTGT